MTKCGRQRNEVRLSDYAPDAIRASVKRSLAHLRTEYLDVVYLHDVEFVCARTMPRRSGNHLGALTEEEDARAYGLAEGSEGAVLGEGDRAVVDAVREMRKMKEEGLIRNVGIAGTPSRIIHLFIYP